MTPLRYRSRYGTSTVGNTRRAGNEFKYVLKTQYLFCAAILSTATLNETQ